LLSTYEAFAAYMENDPDTGLPWSGAAVNNLKSGYKITA
jgi:hypothetical protein